MNFNNNNNKKINNEVELNNNKGDFKMNNTNIYIEENNQLREIVEKLKKGEKLTQLQEEKVQEITEEHEKTMKSYRETTVIEDTGLTIAESLQLEHDTDVAYEVVANELSNPNKISVEILTEKAIKKISNNGLEEIDDARKEFVRDMVEGAIDNML